MTTLYVPANTSVAKVATDDHAGTRRQADGDPGAVTACSRRCPVIDKSATSRLPTIPPVGR